MLTTRCFSGNGAKYSREVVCGGMHDGDVQPELEDQECQQYYGANVYSEVQYLKKLESMNLEDGMIIKPVEHRNNGSETLITEGSTSISSRQAVRSEALANGNGQRPNKNKTNTVTYSSTRESSRSSFTPGDGGLSVEDQSDAAQCSFGVESGDDGSRNKKIRLQGSVC